METNNLLRGFQNQFTLEVVSKTSSETVSKQVCSESRGESKGTKKIHRDEHYHSQLTMPREVC